jgi:hypothetical protein
MIGIREPPRKSDPSGVISARILTVNKPGSGFRGEQLDRRILTVKE